MALVLPALNDLDHLPVLITENIPTLPRFEHTHLQNFSKFLNRGNWLVQRMSSLCGHENDICLFTGTTTQTAKLQSYLHTFFIKMAQSTTVISIFNITLRPNFSSLRCKSQKIRTTPEYMAQKSLIKDLSASLVKNAY